MKPQKPQNQKPKTLKLKKKRPEQEKSGRPEKSPRLEKSTRSEPVQHKPEKQRLQKYLAHHGLGSRREIETWITAGKIKVNGEIASLGSQVDFKDKIEIAGKLFKIHQPRNQKPGAVEKTKVIIYHKSAAELCTKSDPEGRPTVFENLPRIRNKRWVMIGRLDCNTSGLLLFTDNGELAHRLMHPSYAIEREYAVRVLGSPSKQVLSNLKKGVELEDGIAKFETITAVGGTGINQWYHVTLKEGRNREVRRLWESQGLNVSRLIRVRYAFIQLPRFLKLGRWEELEEKEVKQLLNLVNMQA
ncbi:MAG: 23S rRNA pseudouridine(2605) synthase RluB [Gammaproteobacteria bacterium]